MRIPAEFATAISRPPACRRLLPVVTVLLTGCWLAFGASQASASHVSCGDTIIADTTLDSDLVDCPGNGIVIGADDVTLDLNGHTIDGDGGSNTNLNGESVAGQSPAILIIDRVLNVMGGSGGDTITIDARITLHQVRYLLTFVSMALKARGE